ncbi:unnamed protein product [Blepharisma stoltei]|uniref:LITAF domain-containing protein n=1 Tax=Blepharisma stoltei TaxID=1481888 RepID=A0AAU9JW63_9CILI|nr:unnamed protein product [Blepharisma stoltei]
MEIPDDKGKSTPENSTIDTKKIRWSHKPQIMTCKHCDYKGLSKCEYDSGFIAWLMCGACIMVGCVFCCCLCPFCIEGLKICHHICPHCNKLVGSHHPGKL